MGWRPQPRFDPRNRHWHVNLAGKRHYLGADYKHACRRFTKLLEDHELQPLLARPDYIAELVELWLGPTASPWKHYIIQGWTVFEAETLLEDLSTDCLERYDQHLQKIGNSPQTRRHKVAHAGRVCRWAGDQGWLDSMPRRPTLPEIPSDPKDIPLESIPKILDALDSSRRHRARNIFEFLLATGCRPREARLAEWVEINLQAKTWRIPAAKTKTRKSRTVWLNAEALAALKLAADRDDSDHVFLSCLGRPYTKDGLRSVFARVGCTPYQLRHTFAQNALDQFSLEDVAKLLGHSDKSMRSVHVYAQVRDRRTAQVSRSLVSPSRRALSKDHVSLAYPSPDRRPKAQQRQKRKSSKRRSG